MSCLSAFVYLHVKLFGGDCYNGYNLIENMTAEFKKGARRVTFRQISPTELGLREIRFDLRKPVHYFFVQDRFQNWRILSYPVIHLLLRALALNFSGITKHLLLGSVE